MITSETVSCINVICSDKTGTPAENKMKVQAFYDEHFHIECSEFSDLTFTSNICINDTADLGPEGQCIWSPSECALLKFYEESVARRTSGEPTKKYGGAIRLFRHSRLVLIRST